MRVSAEEEESELRSDLGFGPLEVTRWRNKRQKRGRKKLSRASC
jgi:hypothetical protein